MCQFLNHRNRTAQFLILGIIFLSFYAYCHNTANKTYQQNILTASPTKKPSSAINTNLEQRNPKTSPNISKHPTISNQETSSVKKPILEQPRPETLENMREHPSTSTSLTVFQSVWSFLSNLFKSSEHPVIEQLFESQHMSADIVTPDNNRSIADIYQAGHPVSIPEKCPHFGADLKLLILIMSAPSHAEARTAIRLTWGHFDQRKDVSIAFLLGNTNDSKIANGLLSEQEMYGDIIRGNFVDSYSNLTLKAISVLEWVCNYCGKVKFVLKTDDDMFINVPRLLLFIDKHSKARNVIFGRLGSGWSPWRNNDSKYYVPETEYKPEVFPDFTTGPAYLMSGDVVPKLYRESLNQTYMKLEDVFITGIVAQKLGIKRKPDNGFRNEKIKFSACNVQRSISIHKVSYKNQFNLWKQLLDGENKC